MNSQELAYVIITPYSLSKSRTGGIIARLIARTGLELVGARMFAPGRELITRTRRRLSQPRIRRTGRSRT